MTGKVRELGQARDEKLVRDLGQGAFPAVSRGWEIVEQLIVGLERGGLSLDEIVWRDVLQRCGEAKKIRQAPSATSGRW
jgi:hypothetical protein